MLLPPKCGGGFAGLSGCKAEAHDLLDTPSERQALEETFSAQYCGWPESISHHLRNHGTPSFVGIYRGIIISFRWVSERCELDFEIIRSIQSVTCGGAKWIWSIHSRQKPSGAHLGGQRHHRHAGATASRPQQRHHRRGMPGSRACWKTPPSQK